jgi:microcystin-dependent protein
MADPFVAEIRMFGFNFAPRGWAFCDGQILPISQNTALFSLLGTQYGGNGQSTFALPNLQGASPMAVGQGQGLSQRFVGETGGSTAVTLLQTEIPVHTHSLRALNSEIGALNAPGPDRAIARSGGATAYQASNTGLVPMSPQALSITGASLPHNNMQPYLAVNFCIAMQGVFPPRT